MTRLPVPRLLMVAALAVLAMSCSSNKNRAVPLALVKHVLSDSQLGPKKVRLVVTVATGWTPPKAVNYCAAEAVDQSSATSLDVDGGRAIVMVFEDGHAADNWMPRPECPAKPLRVRNVIAVPTHGRLSQRLRHAIHRLR
jgi:hypothetical protein